MCDHCAAHAHRHDQGHGEPHAHHHAPALERRAQPDEFRVVVTGKPLDCSRRRVERDG